MWRERPLPFVRQQACGIMGTPSGLSRGPVDSGGEYCSGAMIAKTAPAVSGPASMVPASSNPAGPLHLRECVDLFIWPAWIEVAVGGLGVAWALSTFNKPQPSRELNVSRWGLLIFGVLLVLVGLVRLLGL